MKKTLIIAALLAGAVSVYSQGQVDFYNFSAAGTPLSTLHAQIFNISTATTTTVTYNGYTVNEEMGDVAAGVPAGNSVYSGAALQNSAITTGFSAQMLASTAASDTLADLSPVGTVMSFYTTAAGAGYLKGVQVVSIAGGTVATIAIAAWQNTGVSGPAATLVAAQADGYAWGISDLANDPLAVSPATPTAMPTSIESFSIGLSVPEPSTIALGVMGASALLFRRRK
jgi:hypothetical protein